MTVFTDGPVAANDVASLNDRDAIARIELLAPKAVFVASTGMLRKPLLQACACPVVNYHSGVNPAYRGNRGVHLQDMTVQLTDRSGHVAAVAASQIDDRALVFQPGPVFLSHFILTQLRFPLAMFHGVELRNLSSVRFVFDRTPKGVINVSDLAFSRGAI